MVDIFTYLGLVNTLMTRQEELDILCSLSIKLSRLAGKGGEWFCQRLTSLGFPCPKIYPQRSEIGGIG